MFFHSPYVWSYRVTHRMPPVHLFSSAPLSQRRRLVRAVPLIILVPAHTAAAKTISRNGEYGMLQVPVVFEILAQVLVVRLPIEAIPLLLFNVLLFVARRQEGSIDMQRSQRWVVPFSRLRVAKCLQHIGILLHLLM
jgi:hypothetical protein